MLATSQNAGPNTFNSIEGASFKPEGGGISLPSMSSLGTSSTSSPQSLQPPMTRFLNLEGVNMVVVEDDSGQCKLLNTAMGRMFKANGSVIHNVGQSLDDLLAKIPPGTQVLLTDMNMPGVSGGQLLAALKSQRPEILCLAISGRLDEHEKELSALGVRCLGKPYDFSQLREFVVTALNDHEILKK